jgi:hypothetical protein
MHNNAPRIRAPAGEGAEQNSAYEAVWITVWIMLIAAGFAALYVYAETPEQVVASPLDRLYFASGDEQDSDDWRLIMAIHPQCPCSLASTSELQRLLARVGNQTRCTVLVYRPQNAKPQWANTHLTHQLRSTPGVEIEFDDDAMRATELGIATSGAVVLFDADGRLRFQGGITPSRGHEGDNPGTRAVQRLIQQGESAIDFFPAYGCRLTDT